jgi:hypothetical protein
MRIVSLEEAASLVGTTDIQSFFECGSWQYPDPVPSYSIPRDSGGKVHMARVIARAFMDNGPALVWVTGTGVWPSSEHMDLFNGYRLSTGDARKIEEAPLQLFGTDDVDALVSILCLGLFFVWDLEVIALNRSLAATISHDEWFEYRVGSENRAIMPTIEAKLAFLKARTLG